MQDGSKKQPYYISMGEDSVMHMAGLYDVWHTSEGSETLATFTILTTASSKRLAWCAFTNINSRIRRQALRDARHLHYPGDCQLEAPRLVRGCLVIQYHSIEHITVS